LTLQNDPAYVEMALALADRILCESAAATEPQRPETHAEDRETLPLAGGSDAVAAGEGRLSEPDDQQAFQQDAIERACLLALSRPPRPSESMYLGNLIEKRLKWYEDNPAEADSLVSGASNVYSPQHENRAELAAWFYIATVLLNLDESITRG
jgi:hypothetical protein